MASRNYEIGRRFEYRVQNFFRKYGYYVIRAYASKGLLDLIAIPPATSDPTWYNFPLGIQCKKNGYVPKAEREKLLENAKKWQMNISVVWSDKNTHKMRMRTVDGTELSSEAVKVRKK